MATTLWRSLRCTTPPRALSNALFGAYVARKVKTLLPLPRPPMPDKEATGHGVTADITAAHGTRVTAPEPELYAAASHVSSNK